MPDKSQQLIVDALNRAVAAGSGISLFGGRTGAGLFASTGPGKKAAQQCKELGYLQVLRSETKGKTTSEICAISERGLAFLLAEQNPKQVLEALILALHDQRLQVDQIASALQTNQENLQTLKATAERVLLQFQQPSSYTPPSPIPLSSGGREGRSDGHTANGNGNGKASCASDVLERLTHWHNAGALGDCPIPHLHRGVVDKHPHITVGQFHDVLRQLNESQKIYLHPWTGPLYEIPEPRLALMVGHEIAWYVSLR